jgi:hypothetical protein
VSCESNAETATIQHAVTLGVYCTDQAPDNLYNFSDPYFECTESTDQFKELSGDGLGFNSTASRYACTTSAAFAPGSSSSNPQIISSVAITTDDYWLSAMNEPCFTSYVSAPPVQTTSAPVTPSPTVMNTASPSLFPTSPPMDQLTSQPTNAPVAAVTTPAPALIFTPSPMGMETTTTSPSLFPTSPPMDQLTNLPTNPPVAAAVPNQLRTTTPILSRQSAASSEDGGKLIGGVVGGIAAAIVIVSMIGFLVWRRQVDSSDSQKPDGSGVLWSFTDESGGNDNSHEPTSVSTTHQPSPTPVPPAPMLVTHQLPPTPVPPVPMLATHQPSPVPLPFTNYGDVEYKDQSRTVIGVLPAVAIAEVVPFPAHAFAEYVPFAIALEASEQEPFHAKD